MDDSVYIIDFSNFVYKFKSVYKYAKISINGVDVDTSVLVGFIRCLKANLANNIVIVLDGVPIQSKRVLPTYKGQRSHDEIPSMIGVPKLEVIKFLTRFGELINKNIKVVCSPGQETDEVISSIIHHITGHIPNRADFISKLNSRPLNSDRILKYLDADGVITETYKPNCSSAVIASTDGDFIQLQRWDNIFIDTSSSGKEISNIRKSKSTSEVSPLASIVYKAIYGDVSDNIPAIKMPWKKEDVINRLNKYIKIEEDLNKFYDSCMQDRPFIVGLRDITNYISRFAKFQFEINWAVAFLTFRSYPIKLYYPNYDIRDTIKKYKLKV